MSVCVSLSISSNFYKEHPVSSYTNYSQLFMGAELPVRALCDPKVPAKVTALSSGDA